MKREKFSGGELMRFKDSLKKAFVIGQRFLGLTYPLV